MDAMDVAILRRLIQEDAAAPLTTNPMRSLRAIARDLEVDKETVRQRLLRLRQGQFLQPSAVMVNPVLAGLRAAHVWMDGIEPEAKPDVLADLHARPGIVLLNDYLGHSLYALELHPAGEAVEERRERVRAIPGIQHFRHEELWFPPTDLRLGSLDWRIVRSLQENPNRSAPALAERVGLSARTVRRRLERLIEGSALFVVPRFHLEALEGSMADLAVFHETGASKSAFDQSALSKLTDSLIRAELHNPTFSFFNLILDNVARVRGLVDWAESKPGVDAARLDFILDRMELVDHMYRLYEDASGPADGGTPRG